MTTPTNTDTLAKCIEDLQRQLTQAIRERDEAIKESDRQTEIADAMTNYMPDAKREADAVEKARYDAFTEAAEICGKDAILLKRPEEWGFLLKKKQAILTARDNKKSENSACNTQRWV